MGYFGSLSRYLRTWLSLQHCADYPWPPFAWSPGHPAASAGLAPGSYRALKRAENLLGAVVVPMSQVRAVYSQYIPSICHRYLRLSQTCV